MKVKYSKIDAAKTQLDQAIKLYFEDEDPASIHTLYGAAHKIIACLLNSKGLTSSIDEMAGRVKPEKKKDAYVLFHKVRNYLKHAEYDSEETLEFDTDLNDLSLFIALRDYQILKGPETLNMALFKLWFMPRNPELFTPLSNELNDLLRDLNLSMKKLDKNFYFRNAPKIAAQQGIDLIGRSNG